MNIQKNVPEKITQHRKLKRQATGPNQKGTEGDTGARKGSTVSALMRHRPCYPYSWVVYDTTMHNKTAQVRHPSCKQLVGKRIVKKNRASFFYARSVRCVIKWQFITRWETNLQFSITVNWFVLALHITIFALNTRSDI